MPEVKTKSGKVKHFSYTAKGKEAAKAFAKKIRKTDTGFMTMR